MASFNKVILLGNLTRDPETRTTAGGLTIAKLGLAVSRVYSTKDGERKEETTFVDVDCFGKQAEVIAKYCRKGKPLMIEGRLKLDQWEAQDGTKRQKLGVVLETFQFIGTKEGSAGASRTASGSQNPTPSADHPPGLDDPLDEEPPF